ncbi:MAG: hypothetical protein ACLRT5_14605 [Lachnospiraceae bacterium]
MKEYIVPFGGRIYYVEKQTHQAAKIRYSGIVCLQLHTAFYILLGDLIYLLKFNTYDDEKLRDLLREKRILIVSGSVMIQSKKAGSFGRAILLGHGSGKGGVK